MKIIAILVSLFSLTNARKWAFPPVASGGSTSPLGPLTEDLALQLAQTATTAYVVGSAAKYIARKTDSRNSNVR